MATQLKLMDQESLAEAVDRACDSTSQDCEFKPHTGHGAYLKKNVWIRSDRQGGNDVCESTGAR